MDGAKRISHPASFTAVPPPNGGGGGPSGGDIRSGSGGGSGGFASGVSGSASGVSGTAKMKPKPQRERSFIKTKVSRVSLRHGSTMQVNQNPASLTMVLGLGRVTV